MFAVKGHSRLSVVAVAVMLLGVFLLPIASAASNDSGGHTVRVQRFLLLRTHPSDQTPTALGFGPIHAKGFDNVINRRKDVFVFPKGKLVIRHRAADRHLTRDQTTCLGRYRERGHYRIVRGTGAYAGARGRGHYHVKTLFIRCRGQDRLQEFVEQIKLRGSIRL